MSKFKYGCVGQYTIVSLYGDLLGARVNVLMWQISAGAGICVYSMIWHMRGYLRCYSNLARVRGHIYQATSLRNRRP